MIRCVRWLLSFRYKVEIKGAELLDSKHTFLVMPSHVAYVDPLIIYTFFGKKIRVCPVMSRAFYDNILLKPFCKLF